MKCTHFQACSAHLASEKETIVSYFAEKIEAIIKELPCAPTMASSHPQPTLLGALDQPVLPLKDTAPQRVSP